MSTRQRGRAIDLGSALERGLRRFRRLARRTAHRATAARVHDLRVATRKLRAEFWLIPAKQRTRAIRRARRDLQQLSAILGEQRKYDVALADAAQYGSANTTIKRRLDAARRDVMRALRRKQRARYRRHLEQAIGQTEELGARIVDARVAKLRRQLEHSRQHPPSSDAARHRLRITVKKARYLLEAAGEPAGRLAVLQDHLGRWHDLMVLSDITGQRSRLTAARNRQWRLAEHHLRPALMHAIEHLSHVIATAEPDRAAQR